MIVWKEEFFNTMLAVVVFADNFFKIDEIIVSQLREEQQEELL